MKNQSSSGIGFLGLLALILITLKLGEFGVVADWSWWWVLAPLWVPVAVFLVAVPVFALAYAAVKGWRR